MIQNDCPSPVLAPLPDVMLRSFVQRALEEDLSTSGDVTSRALIPATQRWDAHLVTRHSGVIAGLDLVRLSVHALDPSAVLTPMCHDGDSVHAGTVLARLSGSARALLTAERTALNFLTHLSGIATFTRAFVEAVKPYPTGICCTRKTIPGLRALAKYAVRAGGGRNHRFGLGDGVLIKDNHIALAGSIQAAVAAARAEAGHLVAIEVEVETLEAVRDALQAGVDSLQCDNMTPDLLRQTVVLTQEYRQQGHRIITLASGGITLENARSFAASGVDLLAVGALTHSAPALDIGLDDA